MNWHNLELTEPLAATRLAGASQRVNGEPRVLTGPPTACR
jgi:hypothetical protein